MAMTGGTAQLLNTGLFVDNPNRGVQIYAYYKTTQDTANNRSTITVGMYVVVGTGWSIGAWTDYAGSYIGTKENTFDGSIGTISGTYWLVENKTFTVNHNSDGTGKATIYWKWGVRAYDTFISNYYEPSGSFEIELPTIARTSTVSAGASTVQMGKALAINVSRKNSAFTHTLRYRIGSKSGTIATGVGTSYSWTVPTSLASAVSGATSGSCTIECDTYSGSTKIGTSSCTVTMTVPDASVPTLSATSVSAGSTLKITTNRKSEAFVHTLKYSIGSASGTIATGIGAEATCTVPDLDAQITDAASGTLTITCITYNGSAEVGSKTVSCDYTLTGASVPTLSATSVTKGSSLKITTNRESTAYTHTISYTIGSASGTIATGVGADTTWSVPDLTAQISNATSGTITITCTTYNGSAEIGSTTVTCTYTGPAATKPTVSPSSVVLGSSVTITMSRGYSGYTHDLTYSMGNLSGTIGTKLGTSKSWTVPTTLASAISGAASGTVTITCKTYHGTALIGTQSCSLTVTAPEASVPTLSATSVTSGTRLKITTNRKSSAFTHTIKYSIGSKSGTVATNVTTSTTWTVPDLTSGVTSGSSGTITITCITYNGSTQIGSKTVTCTYTVPAATVPTLSVYQVALGGTVTITMNRSSGSYTHDLTYSINGVSGTIGTGLGTSKSWTVPASLASAFPDATSAEVTITCVTKSGSSTIGSNSVELTVVIAAGDGTNPEFTVTLAPVNNIPAAFGSYYIQGKSRVRADYDATSEYSTIASYDMTVDGLTYNGNPGLSSILSTSGSIPVKCVVTDARGFYTESTQNITVYAYARPMVSPYEGNSAVVCSRCTRDGQISMTGEYLLIKASRTYSALKIDGVQKNFCLLRYRYKMASASDFSEWVTLIGKDDLETSQISIIPDNVTLAVKTEYVVQLGVVDDMGESYQVSIPVPASSAPFHLGEGGRNVSVGQFCDYSHTDAFDIGWKTYFNAGVGIRAVFSTDSASEVGWKHGTALNSAFPDADMSLLEKAALFLAVIYHQAGNGTSDALIPVLCGKISGRVAGVDLNEICGCANTCTDADPVRHNSYTLRFVGDGNGEYTFYGSYLRHLNAGAHGSAVNMTQGTEFGSMWIAALYAIL